MWRLILVPLLAVFVFACGGGGPSLDDRVNSVDPVERQQAFIDMVQSYLEKKDLVPEPNRGLTYTAEEYSSGVEAQVTVTGEFREGEVWLWKDTIVPLDRLPEGKWIIATVEPFDLTAEQYELLRQQEADRQAEEARQQKIADLEEVVRIFEETQVQISWTKIPKDPGLYNSYFGTEQIDFQVSGSNISDDNRYIIFQIVWQANDFEPVECGDGVAELVDRTEKVYTNLEAGQSFVQTVEYDYDYSWDNCLDFEMVTEPTVRVFRVDNFEGIDSVRNALAEARSSP